ncbi:hypothetical protein D3C81_582320 [compost metagenome]
MKREQAYVEIKFENNIFREKVDGRLGSGKIELHTLRNTGIGKRELDRVCQLDRIWFEAFMIDMAKADNLLTTYKGVMCSAEEALIYFETGVSPDMQRQGKGVIVKVRDDVPPRTDIIIDPIRSFQREPLFGPDGRGGRDARRMGISSAARREMVSGAGRITEGVRGLLGSQRLGTGMETLLTAHLGDVIPLGRPSKDRLTKAAKRFNKQAGKFKITQ